MQVSEYVTHLFKGVPQDQWITLSRFKGHGFTPKQACFQVSQLADVCEFLKQNPEQFYIGVLPQSVQPVSGSRSTAANASYFTCLWADIDVGNDGHKTKGNAPDFDTARRLLADAFLTPSILINTGGGLHAYWLLAEPIKIHDGNRTELQALEADLLDLIQACFQKENYKIDVGVKDFARVLRPVGTLNCKNKKRKEVVCESSPLTRWKPEELRSAIDSRQTISIFDEPEYEPLKHDSNPVRQEYTGDSFIDQYNKSTNVMTLLSSVGWTDTGKGNVTNEYVTRPNKSHDEGHSGTIDKATGLFYCFSSNASPFNANEAYSPFQVYALINFPNVPEKERWKMAVNKLKGTIPQQQATISQPEQTKKKIIIPPILTADEIIEQALPCPDIWEGMLRQGGKLFIGAPSKAKKTWTLLALGLAISEGMDFWGRMTRKTKTLFLNNEIGEWPFAKRVKAIKEKMGLAKAPNFHVQSWRGNNQSIDKLADILIPILKNGNYGLLIIDPIYKTYGNRDENSAGDMADLCNQLERIAVEASCTVVISVHYAKGNSSAKEAMDRISGSGVLARDPDSLVTMTPHQEDDCYTVHLTPRDHADMKEFVVRWDFPLYVPDLKLDPTALKQPIKPASGVALNDEDILSAFEESSKMTIDGIISHVQKSKASAGVGRIRKLVWSLAKDRGLLTWAKAPSSGGKPAYIFSKVG